MVVDSVEMCVFPSTPSICTHIYFDLDEHIRIEGLAAACTDGMIYINYVSTGSYEFSIAASGTQKLDFDPRFKALIALRCINRFSQKKLSFYVLEWNRHVDSFELEFDALDGILDFSFCRVSLRIAVLSESSLCLYHLVPNEMGGCRIDFLFKVSLQISAEFVYLFKDNISVWSQTSGELWVWEVKVLERSSDNQKFDNAELLLDQPVPSENGFVKFLDLFALHESKEVSGECLWMGQEKDLFSFCTVASAFLLSSFKCLLYQSFGRRCVKIMVALHEVPLESDLERSAPCMLVACDRFVKVCLLNPSSPSTINLASYEVCHSISAFSITKPWLFIVTSKSIHVFLFPVFGRLWRLIHTHLPLWEEVILDDFSSCHSCSCESNTVKFFLCRETNADRFAKSGFEERIESYDRWVSKNIPLSPRSMVIFSVMHLQEIYEALLEKIQEIREIDQENRSILQLALHTHCLLFSSLSHLRSLRDNRIAELNAYRCQMFLEHSSFVLGKLFLQNGKVNLAAHMFAKSALEPSESLSLLDFQIDRSTPAPLPVHVQSYLVSILEKPTFTSLLAILYDPELVNIIIKSLKANNPFSFSRSFLTSPLIWSCCDAAQVLTLLDELIAASAPDFDDEDGYDVFEPNFFDLLLRFLLLIQLERYEEADQTFSVISFVLEECDLIEALSDNSFLLFDWKFKNQLVTYLSSKHREVLLLVLSSVLRKGAESEDVIEALLDSVDQNADDALRLCWWLRKLNDFCASGIYDKHVEETLSKFYESISRIVFEVAEPVEFQSIEVEDILRKRRPWMPSIQDIAVPFTVLLQSLICAFPSSPQFISTELVEVVKEKSSPLDYAILVALLRHSVLDGALVLLDFSESIVKAYCSFEFTCLSHYLDFLQVLRIHQNKANHHGTFSNLLPKALKFCRSLSDVESILSAFPDYELQADFIGQLRVVWTSLEDQEVKHGFSSCPSIVLAGT